MYNFKLHIEGNTCTISGNYPVDIVKQATGYDVPGHKFSPLFRRKIWDGRKYLWNKKTLSFPAGLVNAVVLAIKSVDPQATVSIEDSRVCPAVGHNGFDLLGIDFGKGKYSYQQEAVEAAIKLKRGILKCATNCISGETIVELNRAGKSFKTTVAQLYKRTTEEPVVWQQDIETKIRIKDTEGSIILVPISSVTDSGNKTTFQVKTASGKIIRATKDHRFLSEHGWLPLKEMFVGIKVYVDGGPPKRKPGTIRNYQATYKMENHPYRAKHTDNRKKSPNNVFYSVQTHRIVYEAHMNGLSLDNYLTKLHEGNLSGLVFIDPKVDHVHHKDHNVRSNSLDNLELSNRIEHWREHGVSHSWRNVTSRAELDVVTEISEYGKEHTYDIEVCHPEHNFLANGFVVHNSGKTAISCAMTKHLSVPTLFLVASLDLVDQTRKVFAKRLGLPLDTIGVIGDGEFTLGQWITIGTPDTLVNRLDLPEVIKFIKQIQLLFADEVHTAGAETFYEVLDAIPAYYRIGLSGTPLARSDGANLKIIAQTGEVIYEVTNKQLIDLGVSARPHIEFITIKGPKIKAADSKKLNWHAVDRLGVVENKELNSKIVEKVKDFKDKKLFTVVLIDKIDHGHILEELLQQAGVKATFIYGEFTPDVRKQVLDQFAAHEIDCVVGSTILDTGIDLPEIDAMIFGSGGRSVIRALQRLGRGMRIRPDKDKFYVVDFANFCHKWLSKHSIERISTYQKEDCFVITVSK